MVVTVELVAFVVKYRRISMNDGAVVASILNYLVSPGEQGSP
jgi:hypothetical protein